MKKGMTLGNFGLFWLNGGEFELDGGAMFGVVPKVLWSRKYPSEDNCIPLAAWPILVRTPDALVLIETGIGNKLSGKQKRIFRVRRDWSLLEELSVLGIRPAEIHFVILTHCDFDHAGGLVTNGPDGRPALTFPNAVHVVQAKEWADAMNPDRRSANTYWRQNLELLDGRPILHRVEGEEEVTAGVRVIPTGGHTRGHQVVRIESGGEVALHMADLMPTHAHFNPLWVMAYDNFPLEAVSWKERLLAEYLPRNAWFTFYHDPFVCAARFDAEGGIVEKWTG